MTRPTIPTWVCAVVLPGAIACGEPGATPDGGSSEGGDATSSGGGATTVSSSSASTATSAGPGGSTDGDETDGTGDDTDGGSDDTTTGAAPDGTPLFVAAGHMGRTTISCDRGASWIADQSLDDTVRCFDPLDCDHHVGATTGLAFGGGAFVTSLGWGTEGTIRRSTDGVTWEVVATGPTFAGVAFGQDTFVAGNREAWRSIDLGLQWTGPVATGLVPWNGRGVGFTPTAGGTFVVGGGGDNGAEYDIVVSNDAGTSWWHPDTIAPACGDGVRSIVGNDETIVMVRYGGPDGPEFCVSQDQGHVWTAVDLGDTWIESRALWTGTEFIAWGSGFALTSPDGLRWTNTPLEPAINVGAVARDDQGTFVAVRGGWQSWYETQEFYRSRDGRTWEVLPSGSFVGSHPINHVAFGYVDDPTACE